MLTHIICATLISLFLPTPSFVLFVSTPCQSFITRQRHSLNVISGPCQGASVATATCGLAFASAAAPPLTVDPTAHNASMVAATYAKQHAVDVPPVRCMAAYLNENVLLKMKGAVEWETCC